MDNCPISGMPCPHHKCIHITEIKDYHATETKDLCVFCGMSSIDQGQTLKHAAVVDLLDQLIQNHVQPGPVFKDLGVVHHKPTVPPVKTCPKCDHNIYDIAKTGRLGCPHCYEFFKEEIKPLMLNYHKSLQHLGKKPKQPPETLEELQAAMHEAIKVENYELAATLKAMIKELTLPPSGA